MNSFSFNYLERECIGIFTYSTRGKGWIKVVFFDHSAVIVPTSITRKNNSRIWVQNIQQGESIWPHDLIQSMGEGIESILSNKRAEPQTSVVQV